MGESGNQQQYLNTMQAMASMLIQTQSQVLTFHIPEALPICIRRL
jgi:hypothetical protein